MERIYEPAANGFKIFYQVGMIGKEMADMDDIRAAYGGNLLDRLKPLAGQRLVDSPFSSELIFFYQLRRILIGLVEIPFAQVGFEQETMMMPARLLEQIETGMMNPSLAVVQNI